MATLEQVKLYLRIDTDDEDSLLNDLRNSAESYMQDAVDDFSSTYATASESWKAKADQCELLLISDWYENRLAQGRPVSSAVSLLLSQLQLHEVANNEQT